MKVTLFNPAMMVRTASPHPRRKSEFALHHAWVNRHGKTPPKWTYSGVAGHQYVAHLAYACFFASGG